MMLQIEEVARISGIEVDTVRLYEREGYISKHMQLDPNHIHFPKLVINQINFIQNAKKLGFSLTEIGDLISGYPNK